MTPGVSTRPPLPSAGSSLRPGVIVGAMLLATALGFVALGQSLALRATWPVEADLAYLPPSAMLRRLALGHTELAADLIAARANVYYGSQLVSKAPLRHLERFYQTIADLDPRFHRIYLSGSTLFVYNGRPINVDGILAANRLLMRGIAIFPTDSELVLQLGFNEFHELPQIAGEKDPRVPVWRQHGIEMLRQAAQFDDIPPWLPNLVARLLTKHGTTDLAIRHLEQSYAATSNAQTREQIRLKLTELRASTRGDQMLEGQKAYEELLSKGYPYAPESMTIITGPKRKPGINLDALLR